MARWQKGEAEMLVMIDRGQLQRLVGEASNGARLLAKAWTTVDSAELVIHTDPDSAIVLAYDASRQALTALLAHQGLRPTSQGGHLVVEHAAKVQFGPGFRSFGSLRRRRNELEYPQILGDDATLDEAVNAIGAANRIIAEVQRLLPALTLF